MNSFDSYKIYLALKLHFTDNKYDYLKYGGAVRAEGKSFAASPNSHIFSKLKNQFKDKEDFELYCVFNFLSGETYIRNFCRETYFQHKNTITRMPYVFKQDLKVLFGQNTLDEILFVRDNQHPIILTKLLSDEITIESFIILDEMIHFFDRLDKYIIEPFIWNDIKTVANAYRPFLKKYIYIKDYPKIAVELLEKEKVM
jgi:hypothetical protein